MALQVINVGAAPNDGTGDAIRTAYIKCNNNFAEIYSRAQTTPPVSLQGSVGDQAGMYAYDSSFWYYCFADYDGVSTIWAQVAQIGNISVSAIQSGNSSAQFDNIGGNLVISINNTSNVAVFRSNGLAAANITATNLTGTLITASQPNITSVGTLTDLNLSGALTSSANLSTSGNVIGGNLIATTQLSASIVSSSGNITTSANVNGGNVNVTSLLQSQTISATGNIITDGYFVGTFFGNITGNFTVPGSTTQVIFNTAGNADASSNFTFNKTSNVLQVTGNVSTGNVLATTVSASGNITGGNILTSGVASSTGNVTGGNLLTSGIVSAASHIGSVVSASGNITGGNVILTGVLLSTNTISASGNVTGGNLIGGGVSAVSNVTGANLNVTSANITGNATIGNLSVTGATIGNITTTGNIAGGNILATSIISATSYIGSIVSVSSNVTGGNLLTGGIISSTGDITSAANVAGGNLLTGGLVSATGNITSAANIAGGNLLTGGLVSATGNITSAANIAGGNLLISTIVSAASHIGSLISVSGNITGGNLSVSTGSVTLGSIVNANANGVGNIGSSTKYFNTIFAQATSAQYADLAENYLADSAYEPGTVVVIGGSAEVTASNKDQDRTVAGVVSTQPAYIMNSKLTGDNVVSVALIGRVPCHVQGPITKGDLLVTTVNGRAKSDNNPAVGTVIGKALESFNGDVGTIEIVVGKL